MNILVIGSGGREHAICWKLRQSKNLTKLYAAPGNAGIEKIVDGVFPKTDFESLWEFVKAKKIECIVVGPELPLAEGIVDFFNERHIPIWGPTREAAKIESSKIFSKKLMKKYGVPTAQFEIFDKAKEALAYLEVCNYPVVIKADGLAAGKGVIIAEDKEQAVDAVNSMLVGKSFGQAAQKIIIEEFLEGEEASVFAFCDGDNFVTTIASQDHKRALDGDKGLNTGGMGAYAPKNLGSFDAAVIFNPIITGMKKQGTPYRGVLYAGLMLTKDGVKVLEFNCRFGDPETQVVLPLLKTDLVDIITATLEGNLDKIKLEWYNKSAVCVILASGGYPQKYEKGKIITGVEQLESEADIIVFHAGTKRDTQGNLLTNGGRVMGITAIAHTFEEAVGKAYETITKVNFENMHYRRDIAKRSL